MDYLTDQERSWTEHYAWARSAGAQLSGPGATLEKTAAAREWLPQVFARHNIRSVLDAPCGDGWLLACDPPGYLGWDVEDTIIDANRERWPDRIFERVNLLTVQKIPRVDLIVCRDFTLHLPDEYITSLLTKFIVSGSKWLATTTDPGKANGFRLDPRRDRLKSWPRPVNVEAAPFRLKGRTDHVDEGWRELVLFDLDASR